MSMKKIIMLGAVVLSVGLLASGPASADYRYNHQVPQYRDYHRYHGRVCNRVVYRKVCHGTGRYVRCHKERRVVHTNC
jgi:hypothetical protein